MTPKMIQHWEMGCLCRGTRCSQFWNTFLHCTSFTWPTPSHPSALRSSIASSEPVASPDPRACRIPRFYTLTFLCVFTRCVITLPLV